MSWFGKGLCDVGQDHDQISIVFAFGEDIYFEIDDVKGSMGFALL
jgi:hypothetical protein